MKRKIFLGVDKDTFPKTSLLALTEMGFEYTFLPRLDYLVLEDGFRNDRIDNSLFNMLVEETIDDVLKAGCTHIYCNINQQFDIAIALAAAIRKGLGNMVMRNETSWRIL